MQRLATHIAEIPVWTTRALTSEEFDAASLKPRLAANREELLHLHEETVKEAEAALSNASEEELMNMWTLRRGEHTIFSLPKAAVIRNISSNHLYHHRGQLTVYLRLLDVLVPGTYGPSADDAL